jgi:hypothetical protein
VRRIKKKLAKDITGTPVKLKKPRKQSKAKQSEAEKVHHQKQELQRLKFIDKAVNSIPASKIKQANSYLKGRAQSTGKKQARSKSKTKKRLFVDEGEY